VRLVVSDVEPPAELGLARLAHHRQTGAAIELSGPTATPSRFLPGLADADVIEIHAHGVVDHRVADGAFIALSPDADRGFALTARQVRALRLPRAPIVVLGACDAGEVVPYFHAAWSLPAAFIVAGARAVIASTAPMPDDGASQFLAEVSARIQAGTSAAVALRDARRQWRTRPGAAWIEDIVVFE
jgi:CHAT domain-containing protein